MCKITKMAVLGSQNYNSFSDIKEGKKSKSWIFLLILYIRNTGKNMKIEKIISFHTLKNVVIFGYFFAIFDKFPQMSSKCNI